MLQIQSHNKIYNSPYLVQLATDDTISVFYIASSYSVIPLSTGWAKTNVSGVMNVSENFYWHYLICQEMDVCCHKLWLDQFWASFFTTKSFNSISKIGSTHARARAYTYIWIFTSVSFKCILMLLIALFGYLCVAQNVFSLFGVLTIVRVFCLFQFVHWLVYH